MTDFAFTEYSPRTAAPTLAIQFTGELDADSTSPAALAFAHTSNPARTPDLSLTGTFMGFPVRSEPYRHVPQATIPAQVHATLHLAPTEVFAVLVPTPAGGHPAFPGDWIVQAKDGTYSVWSDAKFRAEFDVPEASGSGTGRYGDGSGTGRYGEGDHWTQNSDGTDYPGSYGVGPTDAAPLKPFVPSFSGELIAVGPTVTTTPPATDPITVGSSFRIMRADKSVDPVAHVVKAIDFGLITYESDGETLEVSRDHVVPVVHDILQ
jgi:hypothetical protein